MVRRPQTDVGCLCTDQLTEQPERSGLFPEAVVGPAEWDCFLSVKSVDRIEVTRQPQRATAATIALARLER